MKKFRTAILLLTVNMLWVVPISVPVTASPLSGLGAVVQPNIGVNSFYSMDRAQRGRMLQAAVVMDIPNGYHVNSNRPTGKYLIPTSVKVNGPIGVRVGAIIYPRAIMRSFSFTDQKLSVFEGRAVMRFNVSVPANFGQSKLELKARVRYQSCNDKECYAPATRDVSLWIDVVNPNESAKRINKNIFGGK